MASSLLRLALLSILLAGFVMAGRATAEDFPDLADFFSTPNANQGPQVEGIDMDALRECINALGGGVPGNIDLCPEVVTDADAATRSGVNGDNLTDCVEALEALRLGELDDPSNCILVVTEPSAVLGPPINDVAGNLQECLNRMSGLRPGYPRWGSHMSLCPKRIPFTKILSSDLDVHEADNEPAGGFTESTSLAVTYTVTVHNHGSRVSAPFVVRDNLGARFADNTLGAGAITGSSLVDGCSFVQGPPGSVRGFICNIKPMNPGNTATITFTIQVNATCTDAEGQAGFFDSDNTVTVDTLNAVFESNETNNGAEETSRVNCNLPD